MSFLRIYMKRLGIIFIVINKELINLSLRVKATSWKLYYFGNKYPHSHKRKQLVRKNVSQLKYIKE